MTHTTPIDISDIEQFLRAQRFRHPATSTNYACILRHFNDFLTDCYVPQ